jgi:hypothetical protein
MYHKSEVNKRTEREETENKKKNHTKLCFVGRYDYTSGYRKLTKKKEEESREKETEWNKANKKLDKKCVSEDE